MALSPAQIESFVADGFVRLDDAFPRDVAAAARAILWRDTGASPDDPSTWRAPVIRLGGYADPPFVAAASSPRLRAALDQLVGAGGYVPPVGLGTFPVRFPHADEPTDAGWHIDVSFALAGDDPNDFLGYRANVASRGRALLMLFLFSDVGPDDAPTRIRAGSHADVARDLAPAGDAGLTLRELAAGGFTSSASRTVVTADGPAGTVYLCHPFLVHAAQAHRGTEPRFMGQPPLLPARPFDLVAGSSPVERAIRDALRPATSV
jgi:hypothetical protein